MLFRKLCTSVCNSNHTPFFLYRKSPNISHSFTSNPKFPPKNPLLNPPNPKLFRKNPILKPQTCSSSSNLRLFSPMSDARRPPAVSIPPIETADKLEVFRALEASFGSPFNSEPFVPNPSPLIIVISGPSGVGKDAVIKKLRELRESLHFVVTATSRAMRPGEVDGKDYFFVSKEEFLGMIDKDELLEYALVYGEYKGIPKQQIRDYMAKGNDIVLRVDIQGAATLRKILGRSAVFVFLVAESEDMLVKRLIDRKTESKETLLVRIATAKEEVKHVRDFDYVVVNREGELESSVKLMESIIDAEKARVDQRNAMI